MYNKYLHIDAQMCCNDRKRKKKFKTPLHWALKCGLKLEIIVFIINKFQIDDFHMHDCDGKTPLHYAAIYSTDLNIIKAVGDWNSESCVTHDKFGYTPLHYAIQNNRNIAVIETIVSCNVMAVTITACYVVKNKSMELCDATNGSTPLHIAILAKSEQNVIKYLVNEYPNAIQIQNTNSNIPLHEAIANHSSVDILKLLLPKDNECTNISLLLENCKQKIAIEQCLEHGVDLLSCIFILNMTKRAIDHVCRFERDQTESHLHNIAKLVIDFEEGLILMKRRIDIAMYLIKYDVNEEITDLYFSEFPSDGIIRTESYTCSLLHFAAIIKAPFYILHKIFKLIPENARRTKDLCGNTPLHYIFYNRYLSKIMDGTIFPEILLDKRFYPLSMDLKRQDTVRYLMHESSTLKIATFLYEMWPESLLMDNNNKQIPSDLAVMSYCHIDIIKYLYSKNKSILKHIGFNGNTILHNVCARINIHHIIDKIDQVSSSCIILDNTSQQLHDSLCFESKDRIDIFMWIIQKCDSFVYQANDLGQFPLHIAAINNAEFEILQKLAVKFRKEQLYKEDNLNNVPIYCMLQWQQGSLYKNDKLIQHLVQEHCLDRYKVLTCLKYAVYNRLVDNSEKCFKNSIPNPSETLILGMLRNTDFVCNITKNALDIISVNDMMNGKSGILQIIETLKNSCLQYASPENFCVYLTYYKEIITVMFEILMKQHSVNINHCNNIVYIEQAYAVCFEHLKMFTLNDFNSTNSVKRIKIYLETILFAIQNIHQEKIMAEKAESNAQQLITEVENDAAQLIFNRKRKKLSRSRRGKSHKDNNSISVEAITVLNFNSNEDIKTPLEDFENVVNESFLQDEIKETVLVEDDYEELKEKYRKLTEKQIELESMHKKLQQNNFNAQNIQRQNVNTIQKPQTQILSMTNTPEQKIHTIYPCFFCGGYGNLCGAGIHTCFNCIDFLCAKSPESIICQVTTTL